MEKKQSKISKGMKESFIGEWHFFNCLTIDVEFTEDQYIGMFSNLTRNELKTWIEETRICYAGCEGEDEINAAETAEDLAHFYYTHQNY